MTDFAEVYRPPVRVALDGTALAFPPSGIRTYVEALIDQFDSYESAIQLSVATPTGRLHNLLPSRLNRVLWDSLGVSSAVSSNQLLHVPHGSAPLRRSGPVVVTLHDLIPLTDPLYRQSRGMRLYQQMLARTIPRADAIIVPSQFVARETERLLRVSNDRLFVVPMAAGSQFQPHHERKSDSELLEHMGVSGKFVFNVGGFDVRKNLPVLLKAFAMFREAIGEPYQLVIAGAPHTENPLVYPPISPIIEQLRLGSSVILPGFISESQKVALYRNAAMYVTPSLNEGFGMTVLEAMASGSPVVASNRTSLPEVVADAGLLVEPDARTITGAMLSIASDVSRAEELRSRGLQRATQFSWAETARQTQAVYRRTLERAKKPLR